jgi:hypothetical protein
VEDTVRKLIALIALVLVVGCKREEKSQVSEATSAAPQPYVVTQNRGAADTASSTQALADSAGRFPAAKPATPSVTPMIVRTATMKIVVGDTTKAMEAITRAAERSGGFVASSNVWREGELLRARVTLRVPAPQLTPLLTTIRSLSKRVENETISSEDVSQEYVDLASRVRNLEATEEELRQLLAIARERSKKAADVLEVHQELMTIRGEIEQVKGRMRYLSEVTAMSSLSLEVTPDVIAAPVVEPGWRPVVIARDAVRALVGVLQFFATAAIWLAIYLLPIALMLAGVAFFAWKATRKYRAA